MADSFSGWWARKYKNKNTHLMITKEIAKDAYNAGKKRGEKLDQNKKPVTRESEQCGNFECPNCGNVSVIRLIGKR